MSKGLFITAVGTDIGKTYVTGLLVKHLRDAGVNAGYYKAALSGAEEQPDGTWLPGDAVFEADYQASLAKYDYVTMEGSGGIICPIRWDEEHILLEDIIKKLDLGVLVISNAALGSINNCVLTISYLKQKDIPVRGIILNNYDGSNFMQADNKRMMEEITAVPVLACVPPNASELDIDVEVLKGLYK